MPAHTITPPPPWATRSTMLTSTNRSPTRRHTRCLPSALYSEIWDSSVKRTPPPKCQTPSNLRICPLKSVTTMICSQVETPMRTTNMQMSFPETVSDSLCRNSNRLLQQLFGWLVSDNLGGEDAGCGGPGLVWLHVVCDCEAGFSEMPLETDYGREMSIQFMGNSSGGHSCSQHANCNSCEVDGLSPQRRSAH